MADSMQVVAAMVHDSVIASVPDTLVVVQHIAPATTFWGMSYELATIVVPTFVTILVFVLGYVIDALIKHCNAKRETEEFRNAVFAWVDLAEPAQLECAQGIKRLIDDIESNTKIIIPNYYRTKPMIDKLGIVTAENVMKYFIFRSTKPKNDKRSQYAYSIISCVDSLQALEDECNRLFVEFKEHSKRLTRTWNESIIHLQKLIRDGAKSKKDKDLFDNIRNVYYQYSLACKEPNDADVNGIYENLLKDLCPFNL